MWDVRSRHQRADIRGQGDAGFSLMEIMVVLVVISIMVGLLFPALMAARERARLNRARSEVYELQKAWQVYYMTYETLPGYTAMTPAATQELGGQNPNRIVFMEFDPKELADGYRDPWKEHYKLDLAQGAAVKTEWSFQSRVQCVNAQRSKY